MKKYTQWSILGIAFTMLLVLTTACSLSKVQTATPTPTPDPKTPLTILKESQKKMNALQSLAVNGTYASQSSSTTSGDTDTQMKLSGQMSKSPVSLSLHIDATVTTHGTAIPLSLALIAVDQKGYLQNTKRPESWYLLTDQQGKSLLGGGIGSLGTTQSNLLDVATDSDVIDHGIETVNGKQLRHLTIVATDTNKALKKAFLESTGDFKDLTPEQLDSIQLQTGTMDYWIDETTMYTYQQANRYIAQYHVDGNNAVTPGTPNLTKDQTMTLMYSSFNIPVSIKAPENAQPLQSFLDLL
jgi:pectate lyase